VQQIDELFDNKLIELGNEFIILLPHIYETDFTQQEFDEPFKRKIMNKKRL
jgi:hypothetical protein